MRNRIIHVLFLTSLIYATGCNKVYDVFEDITDHKKPPQVTTFVSGLTAPLGMETDAKGQLWVTEAGAGPAGEGRLTLITPDGKAFTAVKGFASGVSPEGGVFGLNHILFRDGILWMLHGVEGRLYRFNTSSFKPGDAAIDASQLQHEDIGTFVKNYVFENDTEESDLFNLAFGPEGDLYIVDAGANAIIRRKSASGALSVFATFPQIANPAGEPAQVEAVPTGIVFDGQKFFVSTFTGFPFPARKATIYQVSTAGKVSVYQSGLTTLTDIELGIDQKPVVLEYGIWTGQEFTSNSGGVVRSVPGKNTYLLTGLNFPNSLERSGADTYYVAQTFEGVIKKVRF
jgi:sugar lactone lactonase YvrE